MVGDPREHRGPVGARGVAAQLVGPEGARVVHVDVDVPGREGVEDHHRPERLELRRLAPRLLLDQPADEVGQDVLLGERLGADGHRALAAGREGGGEGEARIEVQGGDGRGGRRLPLPAPAPVRREAAHEPVEDEGEPRGGGAPHQHRRVVPGLQPAEDVVAEARRPHRGRERRHPHRPHRGGAQPGHDDGHGEGQLDPAQLLPRGHAHRPRRLGQGGGDAGDAGDGVPQDGQHAVQGQADERGEEADALQTQPRQQRHHDREQREARHGLDDRGRPQHRPLQPRHAGHRHPRRQAHRGAAEQGQQRELQVGGEVLRQQRELFAHARGLREAGRESPGRASRHAVSTRGASCAVMGRRFRVRGGNRRAGRRSTASRPVAPVVCVMSRRLRTRGASRRAGRRGTGSRRAGARSRRPATASGPLASRSARAGRPA